MGDELLSDAVLPEFFASFAPADPPRAAASVTLPPVPACRVEAHVSGSEQPGKLLARGSADGSPIHVPGSAGAEASQPEPPAE